MVMSDKRILEAREEGRILIEPYRRSQLSTSSYDVCIGENFYRECAPHFSSDIYNIYDPRQAARVWGQPCKAEPAHHVFPASLVSPDSVPNHGFRDDDRIIMLVPGETILAHTEEFIGGCDNITTMMKARSSLGRSFVLVCKCAGWGDVGYINRWTMEVTNVSKHWYIPLPVGERVAQIIFMETGPILGPQYGETGSYQSSMNVEQIKSSWKPSSMLPSLKRRTS